jgi:hypothetical protein
MSITTFRPGVGGTLPTAHETPGGLASGTGAPHAGPGATQHAALAARAPRRDGTAPGSALRVALDILSQNVGHRLEGVSSKTHVLHQVASGAVNLRGNYPPDLLDRAVGTAVKGWADLAKQSGLS